MPNLPPSPEGSLHMLKQIHPGHTDNWYMVWCQRALWYKENDGDMTGAPELPDE